MDYIKCPGYGSSTPDADRHLSNLISSDICPTYSGNKRVTSLTPKETEKQAKRILFELLYEFRPDPKVESCPDIPEKDRGQVLYEIHLLIKTLLTRLMLDDSFPHR